MRIIAMTAYVMTGDRERCFTGGMDGYLSKPIDRRMLLAVVEQDEAATQAQPRAANLSAARVFAVAETLERLGAESRLDAADAAWRTLSVETAALTMALRQLETRPRDRGARVST